PPRAAAEPRAARDDEPAGAQRGVPPADRPAARRPAAAANRARDAREPAVGESAPPPRGVGRGSRGALPAPPRPRPPPGAGDRRVRSVAGRAHRVAPVRAGGWPMNLRAIGCNFKTASVELREKLAFDATRLEAALAELSARYGAEAVVLGTCNRVEIYLARPDTSPPLHAPL